jgi:hypothetical protein
MRNVMTSTGRMLALLVSATMFAACSAQSGSAPGVPSAPAATHKKGTVVVRIKIPKKRHDGGKGSRYVSPATQSMTLAITGPTAVNETVALTAGSNGCVATVTTTACSLSLTLAAGAYTATISTFDAAGGTGHVLSSAQNVGFTVVAGTNNTVALTLSGAIARFAVLPADVFSTSNVAGGISLYGTAAHALLIEALDASGSAIVGAGAPTYTVAFNTGTFRPTLTQPSAAQPNRFTVQPPTGFQQGTATIGVTASFAGSTTNGCALPAAVCTGSVDVSMSDLVAVSNNNQTVTLYGQFGTAPLATVATASAANAVAFDKTGNLFVATPTTVIEYAYPYTGAGFPLTGSTGGTAIAVDPNSSVVAVAAAGNTQVFTPPFLSAPVTVTQTGETPIAVAFNNSSRLWISYNGTDDEIDEYHSPYNGAHVASISPLGTVTALAFDSGNDMFGYDTTNAAIDEYNSPPTTPNATFANANTTSLAIDPSTNHLFATQCATCNSQASPDQVVQFQSPYSNGSTPAKTITAGVANDTLIVIDGASVLYVINKSSNAIAEFAPDYSLPPVTVTAGITGPSGIAVSPWR